MEQKRQIEQERLTPPDSEIERIKTLTALYEKLEALQEELKLLEEAEEMERIEKAVEIAAQAVDKENEKIIVKKFEEVEPKIEGTETQKKVSVLLRGYKAITKTWTRTILTGLSMVSIGAATGVGILLQRFTAEELIEFAKNPKGWREIVPNLKERQWDKARTADPSIKGVEAAYEDKTRKRDTTWDFIGKEEVPYKWGVYRTRVMDLSKNEKTPPHFEIIERGFQGKIDNAVGIVTNLLNPFEEKDGMIARLQYSEHATSIEGVYVIGYHKKEKIIRAGPLKEFNNEWLVSQTYIVKLDFVFDEKGNIRLSYSPGIYRMAPQLMAKDANGVQQLLHIGITHNQNLKSIEPYSAINFGVLEGGKIILVCGEKQVQVNGSFTDIYRVYERLKKDYPKQEVIAYRLDNGAYCIPMEKRVPGILTQAEIDTHFNRHVLGGTALVLINDGAISPHNPNDWSSEKLKEVQHQTEKESMYAADGKLAQNEHSAVVIHTKGNRDLEKTIQEFISEKKKRAAHVLIAKDGTRHVFNNDNAILDHAEKALFDGKENVNSFALGVEFEGDPEKEPEFSLAQLESLVIYLYNRIKKYNIPLENITTDKIAERNYLVQRSADTQSLTKSSLDDIILGKLHELLQKKIYESRKGKLKGEKSKRLVAAAAYQEGYRRTKDKKQALREARLALATYGVSKKEIDRVESWIKRQGLA